MRDVLATKVIGFAVCWPARFVTSIVIYDHKRVQCGCDLSLLTDILSDANCEKNCVSEITVWYYAISWQDG